MRLDDRVPAVSVILPVYNCPQYVGSAIESILEQTFASFELIVIDDGSTDETPDVLRRYQDPRIRHLAQTNQGLAPTLNRGIAAARGRYIARQDQDDVSLPDRFAKQLAFLDANPQCDLLGTWAEIWEGDARTERSHRHPSANADLKILLLFDNPFVHSSVMIRRSALTLAGAYSTDPLRQPPEDYELWSRLARTAEVANLPEILHVYREVPGSMSRARPTPFVDHLVMLSAENIGWAAGLKPSHTQVINLASLAHRAYDRVQGAPDFDAMRTILRRATAKVAAGGRLDSDTEADRRIVELRGDWDRRRRANGLGRQISRARRVKASLVKRLRARAAPRPASPPAHPVEANDAD
ncbi:MAG: glycosyltransferase [Chloroflexi bacterium]|nr:glycosyltransferase [Chloroflexota bacterium]